MSETGKRVVVATRPGGELYVIGPVYTEQAIDELAAQVRAAGVEVLGIATAQSRSQFRAQLARSR